MHEFQLNKQADFCLIYCLKQNLGVLNLSKIKNRKCGFTDGLLTAVLGTVLKNLPQVPIWSFENCVRLALDIIWNTTEL